jgi:uracil-DNA glycosylase
VFGMGSPTARLMFVGEGPGEQEDRQGLPFVGRSGQLLDRLILEEMGLTRDSVYIANTIKCRPPGNRDPLPEELEACGPYLEAQLQLINPKVVVTLGNFATKRLLGTTEGISRLRGRTYPFRGGYLVPTFHPSAALRGGGQVVAQMRADFVRAKEALGSVQAPHPKSPQAQAASLAYGAKGASGPPEARVAPTGQPGGPGGRRAEPLL